MLHTEQQIEERNYSGIEKVGIRRAACFATKRGVLFGTLSYALESE
jgi:hypothetical protein